MGKILTDNQLKGEQGAYFVGELVTAAGHLWKPYPQPEAGIDGTIEIRNQKTKEMTCCLVAVQVKATSGKFTAETDQGFEYLCEEQDLSYWMGGTAPVLLIVTRPQSREAYWVAVTEYFKDPKRLKSRRIFFEKQTMRLDASSGPHLERIAVPASAGVYLLPTPKPETLLLNLLPVLRYPAAIHIAATSYRKKYEVWQALKETAPGTDGVFALRNGQIISFQPLREVPWASVCDPGTAEEHETNDWANADDVGMRDVYSEMLQAALGQKLRNLGFRWHAGNEYFYCEATQDLRTKRLAYHSLEKDTSREIFKRYGSKKYPDRFFCRHAALKTAFFRFEKKWYLELTPTYHFTQNGRVLDPHYEKKLQGIKLLEKHAAVLGQVVMWADRLKDRGEQLPFIERDPLGFGGLLQFEIPVSIPDGVWRLDAEMEEAVVLDEFTLFDYES